MKRETLAQQSPPSMETWEAGATQVAHPGGNTSGESLALDCLKTPLLKFQSNEVHLLCVSALLGNPSKVYCLSFLSALANRLPVSLTSFLNILEQLAQRTRLQRRNCPRTRASP